MTSHERQARKIEQELIKEKQEEQNFGQYIRDISLYRVFLKRFKSAQDSQNMIKLAKSMRNEGKGPKEMFLRLFRKAFSVGGTLWVPKLTHYQKIGYLARWDIISYDIDEILERNAELSAKQEEAREQVCGMNLKKLLSGKIVYTIPEAYVGNMLSVQYDDERTVHLLSLYYSQHNDKTLLAKCLNRMFDYSLHEESQIRLIQWSIDTFDLMDTLKSSGYNPLHHMCTSYFKLLSQMGTRSDRINILTESFNALVDYFFNLGFNTTCTDVTVIEKIMKERLTQFLLTDNCSHSTIRAAIQNRCIDLYISDIIDYSDFIKKRPVKTTHLFYYSSLTIVHKNAETAWNQAFRRLLQKEQEFGAKLTDFGFSTPEVTLQTLEESLLLYSFNINHGL